MQNSELLELLCFPKKVFFVLSLTPETKLIRLDSETDWTLLAPETAPISKILGIQSLRRTQTTHHYTEQ
jgi:hypothetical protein